MAHLVGQGIFQLDTDSNLSLIYSLDLGSTNMFEKRYCQVIYELHFPQILILLEKYQHVLLDDTDLPL